MNLPQPDNNKAIEFLKMWRPQGSWVLTAIAPDRKGIETKTFDNKNEKALQKWLQSYNGVRNIYFHVNPTHGILTKKAERKDIKSLDWLHVDIDPEEGKNLNQERDAILEKLLDKRPKGLPEPTAIIFSGGGYQAFWKLKEPTAINGNLEIAEDVKRYNQQLETLFNADNCHNIDRIMRLPGSLNIPDAKKIKKGRKLELAKLLSFEKDNVYPLSMFTPASSVQLKNESGFSGTSSTARVEISGNVSRLQSVDELDEWDVPDRVKVAVVQGKHPDMPKEGDNSRSIWLFDVTCNLVRFNVPDDIIYSILTDKDFGISESVIEKKGAASKYAIRQIEKAKEWVIDPMLVKFNEQFAVIGNMGGKCRIIEETLDEGLSRTRLTKQSFEDFRNRFMHVSVEMGTTADGKPKTCPAGKWWLMNPNRRQFDSITFAPGKTLQNSYNLWRGFSCENVPGDCSLFLAHLENVICGGKIEVAEYLLGWLARCVQQPATTGEVAIVLRGGRGTGKSMFAKQFGSLFGRHFLQVSNSGHLVGNFNSHLRDTVVLFADEAFFAGDRKHASVLKTLITEETIPVEAKGVDVETAPNYIHLLMASNETHVIPAGGDERRFLVLDVSNKYLQDTVYFGKMVQQFDNGGKEGLLNYLMSYNLGGFNVRKVPDTEALMEQKLLSLNVEEEWWYQKLVEGHLLDEDETWRQSVVKSDLLDDYIENARRFNVTRRGSATSLGRFLAKVIPDLTQQQKLIETEKVSSDGFSYKDKSRVYHYVIPTLEVCRERWIQLFGKQDWLTAPKIASQETKDMEIPF